MNRSGHEHGADSGHRDRAAANPAGAAKVDAPEAATHLPPPRQALLARGRSPLQRPDAAARGPTRSEPSSSPPNAPAPCSDLKMRMGKTLVALALAVHWRAETVLVVCPARVMDVWRDEAAEHVPGRFTVIMLDQGKSVAKKAQKLRLALDLARSSRSPLIVVVNHESVWRGELAKVVLATRWDLVIDDECHKLKSPGSSVSRFMARVRVDPQARADRNVPAQRRHGRLRADALCRSDRVRHVGRQLPRPLPRARRAGRVRGRPECRCPARPRPLPAHGRGQGPARRLLEQEPRLLGRARPPRDPRRARRDERRRRGANERLHGPALAAP